MSLRAALSRLLSLVPGKGRPPSPPPAAAQKMRRPGRDYEDKMVAQGRGGGGACGAQRHVPVHDPRPIPAKPLKDVRRP